MDGLLQYTKLGCKRLTSLLIGVVFSLLYSNIYAMDDVRLQLKWTHAYQFAGYYAAKHQGYYQDAGINVEIIEGQPGMSVIDEVLSGRADFGISTSSLLLTDPIDDITLLANIFQHSPLVIVALDQGPLFTLHDLDGATIMLEDGADELVAFLVNEGLSMDRINLVPHTFSIDSLLTGEVDAMSTYLTYEIYLFEQADVDIKIFTPRSIGIDFYGDNLFTRHSLAQHNPELAERFLEASLKGWAYALSNINEVVELIQQEYAPDHSHSFLTFEAESMLQLIRPEFVEIGYINPGRWKHIADVYQELGLLDAPPDWDAFFYTPPFVTYQGWVNIIIIVSIVTLLISGIATYIYLVNKRLRQVLHQSQQDQLIKESHNKILAMIADDHSLLSILTEITECVEALYPESLCSIMMKMDESDHLTPIVGSKLDKDYLDVIKKVPITVGAGSCGTAAATRQRVITEDIQDSIYWKSIHEAVVKAELKSCWSQPVLDHSGQLLATFAVYKKHVASPCDDEIALVEEFARLVAIAIDRSKMLNLLKSSEQHHRYLAHHDPLTGLANRSLFADRVKQAIRLAKREGTLLALILIDLNDFKLINDEYGHILGDKLLCDIAKRLKSVIRNSDTVSRYGGDEFVILLQGLTDPSEAKIVEDKIIESMSQPFLLEELEIYSSVSIGTALYPDDGSDEASLTHVADLRMYSYKRQTK